MQWRISQWAPGPRPIRGPGKMGTPPPADKRWGRSGEVFAPCPYSLEAALDGVGEAHVPQPRSAPWQEHWAGRMGQGKPLLPDSAMLPGRSSRQQGMPQHWDPGSSHKTGGALTPCFCLRAGEAVTLCCGPREQTGGCSVGAQNGAGPWVEQGRGRRGRERTV